MDELVKNSGFEKMISNIEVLVNASKSELAISINKVMTVTYWSIGKYIVEFEQCKSEIWKKFAFHNI